jgi:hypothetical protein
MDIAQRTSYVYEANVDYCQEYVLSKEKVHEKSYVYII